MAKLLIVALISTVAIVLSLYNIMIASEHTNPLETIENPFVSYSVNTECEMLSLFIEKTKNSGSVNVVIADFAGWTKEDINDMFENMDKYYPRAEELQNPKSQNYDSGDLAPYYDQGVYQQYMHETTLKLNVEKIIKTNDINPKLESDVRNLLQLLDDEDVESISNKFYECGILD